MLLVQPHLASQSVALRAKTVTRTIHRVPAYTPSNCLCIACVSELVVYSHTRLILGKIRKVCSPCCPSTLLLVEDESNRQVFSLRLRCCQLANILPRAFLCGAQLEYEVVGESG